MAKLDIETREKIAEQLFEASQELLAVYVELQDETRGNDAGVVWVDLESRICEALSDLVATGGRGTAVTLSYEQGKRIAEAHTKSLQAWDRLMEHKKSNDLGSHEGTTFKFFGDASGWMWTYSPLFRAIKPFLPAWAWPDHPDNTMRNKGD